MRVTVFALLCLVGCSFAADITDCSKPDSPGKLTKVQVANCTEEDAACVLKRGGKGTITLEFETTEAITKVKHVVHGIFRMVPIPFKLPSEDACVDTGLTCPLAVGPHKYTYDVPVKSAYPAVARVTVKWQIIDIATGKDVVCVEIPAQVK